MVDNLIVVHDLETKVATLFDIKTSSQFPVASPLPLLPFPDLAAMAEQDTEGKDGEEDGEEKSKVNSKGLVFLETCTMQ